MTNQSSHSKPEPLTQKETDTLLAFLMRLIETHKSETVRRVAQSLFNLLSRLRFLK